EIFNSGEVSLPAPTRDIAVPVDIDGVRKVRFTSTDDESNTPGFAELQVISRPGGAGLDLNDPNDAGLDFDQDGLTNLEEFDLGTSMFLNDTDGDGLADAQELTLGSSPLLSDSDNDGVLDGNETSPTADTDRDGIINLLDEDSDNDGLTDGAENLIGTNPLRVDSNSNGIPDGSEDGDADGLPNFEEVNENTDPANPDSDNDGLLDGEEVVAGADGFITDPLRPDTDGDGMLDGYESRFGLDPTAPDDASNDPDNDGLTNLEESRLGTDPFNPDIVAPNVAQIEPADLSVDVPVNGVVVVRFTEPLLADSIQPGIVQLFDNEVAIPGAVTLSDDALSVTFAPDENLGGLTVIDVEVQAVRDVAGNLMADVSLSSFTTAEFIDDVRPTIVRTSTQSGFVDVPVNAPFTVQFSERMDPATLTTAAFTVRDNTTFQNVAGMIQVDPDGITASFIPEQPFSVGRAHSVTLLTSVADAAGNALAGSRSFSFTTAFVEDSDRPTLVAISPPDFVTNVPVNAIVMLDFSEPLNLINVVNGVQVLINGVSIPGSIALSDGNRRVTFTSAQALSPDTLHQITASTVITDLVGNPLDNPVLTRFQTETLGDIIRPTLVQVSPGNNTVDVSTDLLAQVSFSERMNPLTVTESNFFIDNVATGIPVAGTVVVSADGLSATFTPDAPLSALTSYRVRTISNMQDLAGNIFSGSSVPAGFTTDNGVDAAVPEVLQSSLSGAAAAPVNAQLVVELSEAIDIFSLSDEAVQVSVGGVPISGVLTLSSDRRTLTFVPDTLLAANTRYDILVTGLVDLGGNALLPFADSFTTDLLGIEDTVRPSVAVVSPISGASGVIVDTPIVVTFNEVVDPTSVSADSIPLTVDGFNGSVAASYVVSGNQVTITPFNPLPGNSRVRPRVNSSTQVRDLAGNTAFSFSSFFDTAAILDAAVPEIISITPLDGAGDLGLNTPVVLIFSESLNAATVNSANFTLYANGARLVPGVSRSSDNRTITLSVSLPADSQIQVAVSNRVEDLSGNALVDFVSEFTTSSSFDSRRPSVTTQRPGNGATNVPLDSSLVLFTNEGLDAASVQGALHVSQNGSLVSGNVRVTIDGRAIEFVPDVSWLPNALIQVFLDSTAVDTAGNALFNYQSSFRTVTDPALLRPTVLRDNLFNTGELLNPAMEVEFSEALAPATVDANTVLLRQNISGSPVVVATVSLRNGDRVIRVVPDAALAANTQYFLDITNGIEDLDGQTPNASTNPATIIFRRFFTTGDQSDAQVPTVSGVSPPDGVADVPLNAQVRIRFDEPVNPLTVDGGTLLLSDGNTTVVPCSISFSDGNREVLMVPHAPLSETVLYSLTIAGVEDRGGNEVVAQTTSFTTSASLDTVQPLVVLRTPFSNETDVPVNSPVVVVLDERLDLLTVNVDTVLVRDNTTGDNLAGNLSVSGDGRTVSFAPAEPFAVGRRHSVFASGANVRDLVGNTVSGFNFNFTTAFDEDVVAPQLLGVSPGAGMTDVPINTRVQLRFNEPVQATSISGVTLSANGSEIAVTAILSDANRVLTLTPQLLLDAATPHSVNVAGVVDTAGNALGVTSSSFTVGTSFDIAGPTLVQVSPGNNTVDVSTDLLAQVSFSERMNPLTVTESNFFID
ncbi:hypothetical protein MNBD_GAMMA15-2036, partial [hydrothermal vent metagenome]